MTAAIPSRWTQVWMAEAVQRVEQTGPLDDTQALLLAHRNHAEVHAQVRDRAWRLGERLGLVAQLARWREAGWLVLLVATFAVLALGNGLLLAVLAEARTINAVAAFVAALGLHALTLLLWLLSVLWGRRGGGSSAGGWSLGHWASRLALHWPGQRKPQAQALMRSGLDLLARKRLAPWAFGFVSHAVWALGFVVLLCGLLVAFALREYRLVWESTLLDAQAFASFARIAGALPAWLGVPVPALDGGGTSGAWQTQAAAWWLLACVALYGLLPRVLCALWCALVLRRAARTLELELTEPYFQQLQARLLALAPAEIVDTERPGVATARAGASGGPWSGALAVLGFELGHGVAWPPAGLAERAQWIQNTAGAMAERQQLQRELAALRPACLLVVCDAQASPDRGTARFLRDAQDVAQRCALLLHGGEGMQGDMHPGTPPHESAAVQRWRDWAPAAGLAGWPVFTEVSQALHWAEEGA